MRSLALLATAALVLVAGACGGGDETPSGASPDQWSADVCGALQTWVTDIQTRGQALGASTGNSTSIPDARAKIVDYLDTTVTRTDDMLDKVEAAGAPAVDEGDAIASDLRRELANMKVAFEQARDKAKNLPTEPSAFVDGAQRLGTELAAAGGKVGGRLQATTEKYDAPELQEAVNGTPACQGLG